jgi:hypothetical protein
MRRLLRQALGAALLHALVLQAQAQAQTFPVALHVKFEVME